MNEGLLRQRRNLIASCALIWLLKFGKVSFTKMSLAGFDVSFANPEALYLSLWLSFFYFLYRYYQYFVKFGEQELTQQFLGSLERVCAEWMAQVHKDHPEWMTKTGYPNLAQLVRSGFIVNVQDGSEIGTRSFVVRISRFSVMVRLLRSVFESTFRSTVVTDYVFPFLLAFFVLIYCGVGEWPGSLLGLLR